MTEEQSNDATQAASSPTWQQIADEGCARFDSMIGEHNALVIDGLHDGAYHAIEAFSASGAKVLLRSAAHYATNRMMPREPSAAMQLGTAVHMAILEPERFASKVWISERKTPAVGADGKRKRETEAEREERAKVEDTMRMLGNVILTREQFDIACAIADRANEHAVLPGLLHGARREVSFLWRDPRYGIRCKARADALRDDGIFIDIKTTQDASDEAFGRACAAFDYHVQAAHYNGASEVCLNRSVSAFVFVAIETLPPYGIRIYTTPPNVMLRGAVLVDRAMQTYAESMQSRSWPGYAPTIMPLAFPAWALKEQTR